jgi:type II secretory pathway component PulK
MRGRDRSASGAARPQGFVLVTVLAMLVILTILAATIGTITQRVRDDQLERQRQVQDEIAMASTRASLLYLLTSQRMTFGGLTVDDKVVYSEDERLDNDDNPVSNMPVGNEIALDGRTYLGLDGVDFALQDDRGLLSVNWTSPIYLERYLSLEQPLATPIATLQNLLLDYQDADDLYRLNSAERLQYEKLERPPPSNQTLATPMELRRVIGWDQALAGIDDVTLTDSLTTSRNPIININTAPARVLQSLPGVTADMAARAVASRSLQPFINLPAFFQLLGAVPADPEGLSMYPSPSGILKLWSPRGGAVQVLHWTLTPLDDGGRPWREDYEFTLPQNSRLVAGTAVATAAKIFAEPLPAPQ